MVVGEVSEGPAAGRPQSAAVGSLCLCPSLSAGQRRSAVESRHPEGTNNTLS